MKGIVLVILGIILIAMCGIGFHFLQLDGGLCGVIALFVGGGIITSGVNLVTGESNE